MSSADVAAAAPPPTSEEKEVTDKKRREKRPLDCIVDDDGNKTEEGEPALKKIKTEGQQGEKEKEQHGAILVSALSAPTSGAPATTAPTQDPLYPLYDGVAKVEFMSEDFVSTGLPFEPCEYQKAQQRWVGCVFVAPTTFEAYRVLDVYAEGPLLVHALGDGSLKMVAQLPQVPPLNSTNAGGSNRPTLPILKMDGKEAVLDVELSHRIIGAVVYKLDCVGGEYPGDMNQESLLMEKVFALFRSHEHFSELDDAGIIADVVDEWLQNEYDGMRLVEYSASPALQPGEADLGYDIDCRFLADTIPPASSDVSEDSVSCDAE